MPTSTLRCLDHFFRVELQEKMIEPEIISMRNQIFAYPMCWFTGMQVFLQWRKT